MTIDLPFESIMNLIAGDSFWQNLKHYLHNPIMWVI